MLPTGFDDFLDRQGRDTIRRLRLVAQMLEAAGMSPAGPESGGDPFVYVPSPGKGLGPGGIRIYRIGDALAFRPQESAETHPYGRSYRLPLEDLFQDLMGEKGANPEAAGRLVAKALPQQIREYFRASVEAAKTLSPRGSDRQALGVGSKLGDAGLSGGVDNVGGLGGVPGVV